MRSIPFGRGTAVAVLLLTMSLLPWSASERGPTAAAGKFSEATEPYGLAVTSADQRFVPSDRALRPPGGRKWVVVSASLQNLQETQSSSTRVRWRSSIDKESVTRQRRRAGAQPSLVGATLVQGDWIRGLALFEVGPALVRLEWCPAGRTVAWLR